MKNATTKFVLVCLFIFAFSIKSKANDSLTLAQAYMNMSLTCAYFDSISTDRISKILPFIEKEMSGIKDTAFINKTSHLYCMTYSLLYYAKTKLMFKTKGEISRPVLLKWKSTLDTSIDNFNRANADNPRDAATKNAFYSLIHFTTHDISTLQEEIVSLKSDLNSFFSRDIYPDFQRIFYEAKNQDKFYIRDSLKYFTSLYNIPIEFPILINKWGFNFEESDLLNISDQTGVAHEQIRNSVDPGDDADDPFAPSYSFNVNKNYSLRYTLDVISKYLQLLYIAKKGTNIDDLNTLYDNYTAFKNLLSCPDCFKDIPPDSFFKKELDTVASKQLYILLQNKFPYRDERLRTASLHSVVNALEMGQTLPLKKYFPIPVPFPSSIIAINHFHPDLKTMKQVDDYIQTCLFSAGYQDRLHYYYIHDSGFAVTTSLERIDRFGDPAQPDQRWNLSVNDNGSLSLYSIFRAIFFQTESDFRVIGCIVARREADESDKPLSLMQMTDLLHNSYSALPVDLENQQLPDKTLTILVYHFYQSDVGEVPLLDVTGRLSVKDHLDRTSPLKQLEN